MGGTTLAYVVRVNQYYSTPINNGSSQGQPQLECPAPLPKVNPATAIAVIVPTSTSMYCADTRAPVLLQISVYKLDNQTKVKEVRMIADILYY